MDLISLISKAPGLYDRLKGLGLDGEEIVKLGGELNRQLRKQGNQEITHLLKELDMPAFLAMLDIDELTTRTGIDPARARSLTELLGFAVEAFGGDLGTLGERSTGQLHDF